LRHLLVEGNESGKNELKRRVSERGKDKAKYANIEGKTTVARTDCGKSMQQFNI
jgi:hypothetical protein